MTSLTTNTLRITIKLTESRSVSLKSVCTCLEKEKDLVETGEERGCSFFFLKINEKPKWLMMLIKELLNGFLIYPFSENSH